MNPLFQTFQKQESQQPNIQVQLSNLAKQVQQMGTTPEALGRMLVQNYSSAFRAVQTDCESVNW